MGANNKKNKKSNQENKMKMSTKLHSFLTGDLYNHSTQPKGIINQFGIVLVKGAISVGLFSLGNWAEEKLGPKVNEDDSKWKFNNVKNATASTVGLVSNLSGLFMSFSTAGETIDLCMANRVYVTKSAMEEYYKSKAEETKTKENSAA